MSNYFMCTSANATKKITTIMMQSMCESFDGF